MAKNISGVNERTYIIDKISTIEFESRGGSLGYGSLFTIIGILTFLIYLGYFEHQFKKPLKGAIFVLIFGLFYFSIGLMELFRILNLNLLILRFSDETYYYEEGFLTQRKIVQGSFTEFDKIEIKKEHIITDEDSFDIWQLILKWKRQKEFILGDFRYDSQAVTVARELYNRLKIDIIDKSPSEKYL